MELCRCYEEADLVQCGMIVSGTRHFQGWMVDYECSKCGSKWKATIRSIMASA